MKPAASTVLNNVYTTWKVRPDADKLAQRLRFLRDSQSWTGAEMAAHQDEQIRIMVAHAYRETDYYRTLLDGLGIAAGEIDGAAALAQLPVLDKDTLKSRRGEFIAKSADKERLHSITSGGSTGVPLVVQFDDDYLPKSRAATHYYLGLNGHDPDSSRSVRLHGDAIPEETLATGRYAFMAADNKLVLSSQHIGQDTAETYMREIATMRPHYIHAYPSAIYALTMAFRARGLECAVALDCIYCDSEMLYDGQRDTIEAYFRCRVAQTYSHTEGAAVGVTLPGRRGIYLLAQVGYTEILDPDGNRLTQPGARGEIVVTGFHNPVFPLIRYRTGDIGVIAAPEAGDPPYLRLARIEGRVQDMALDIDGQAAPITPGLFDYNIDWSEIARFQVVQNRPGALTVSVRPEDGIDAGRFDAIARRLNAQLTAVFGGRFNFTVERNDAIDTTGRGKQRYFVQNIPGA